jgi:hypothetical protein
VEAPGSHCRQDFVSAGSDLEHSADSAPAQKPTVIAIDEHISLIWGASSANRISRCGADFLARTIVMPMELQLGSKPSASAIQ